ncbi:MAG: response regulator [Candidatus Acidiferrales bacterium]
MATILVADDNSNIQKMVSLVFEEKGVRVVAVGNGEAACRKVPEVHPDIVLADVFMPVRNGYEVCEFVKHDPQFAEIPVILLVGAFDPLDEKEAQRVGANGVLKKPFVPPEPLIAMVSSFLGNLEPPVEEAPAKVELPVAEKPEIAPPPPPALAARVHVEEEPEPEPEEFTVGMNPRDFDEGEGAARTFGSPVATPSAKHEEDEPADDEEPESEWKRRRATLDYDIPEADSDNLVKRLAGEGREQDMDTVEAVAVPKAHVRVPFGGAIVPEVESVSDERPPQPSTSDWMDLMAPVTAATEEPASKPQVSETPALEAAATEEIAEPAATESGSHGTEPQRGWADAEPQREEPRFESPAQEEDHEEAEDQIEEASSAPQAEVIPFPAPAEHMQAAEFVPLQHADAPVPEFKAPLEQETAETVQSENAETVEASDEIAETSSPDEVAAQSESRTELHTYEGTSPEADHLDALPEAGTKSGVDSATIDDVVARVLEKLEPQIHQLLSNGVLRPLVEEMLNREPEKK